MARELRGCRCSTGSGLGGFECADRLVDANTERHVRDKVQKDMPWTHGLLTVAFSSAKQGTDSGEKQHTCSVRFYECTMITA